MINLIIIGVIVFTISYMFIGVFVKNITNVYIQPLLKEGPNHKNKAGTPTMGGVSFLSIYIATMVIITFLSKILGLSLNIFTVAIILICVFGYAMIGLKDDVDKVKFKKNDKGLTPIQKLFFQFLISVIIIIILINTFHSQEIYLYSINKQINLGYIYYILLPFLFLATTNATNLTDGLDGLLTVNACITIIFLSIIAFTKQNMTIVFSNAIFLSTLVAFYFYNKNPAKIFMGDVGSLSIGGYITIQAILLKVEFLFFLFTFVYFIEALSVIAQVTYFKYTKKKYGKGKRLFLMAPIHHHLEKKNLSENQIVLLFAIINIIAGVLGILLYIS